MKKIFFGIFTAFIFTITANAGFVQSGGFDDGIKITTVQEVANLRDDSNVVLRGHIVNSIGDEKYTFADETGQIVVEIDDEDWQGINVTPNTAIEIFGEVDKGWFKKTKIEVDSVRMM